MGEKAVEDAWKDNAWREYKSNQRKGVKAAAKAVAREHGVDWQPVHEFLTTRIDIKRKMPARIAFGSAIFLAVAAAGAGFYSLARAGTADGSSREIEERAAGSRIPAKGLEGIPGIMGVVESDGEYLDVLYALNPHPNEMVVVKWDSTPIRSFKKACIAIYDRYGPLPLELEGVGKVEIEAFRKGGSLPILEGYGQNRAEYQDLLSSLLQSRKWEAFSNEPDEYMAMIVAYRDITRAFNSAYTHMYLMKAEKYLNERAVWEGGQVRFPKKLSEMLKDVTIGEEAGYIQDELDKVIPPAEELYMMHMAKRDIAYADLAARLKAQGKGTVIVLLGPAHFKTFTAELKNRGLSYAAVQLEGHENPVLTCTPEDVRADYLHPNFAVDHARVKASFNKDRTITLERSNPPFPKFGLQE